MTKKEIRAMTDQLILDNPKWLSGVYKNSIGRAIEEAVNHGYTDYETISAYIHGSCVVLNKTLY